MGVANISGGGLRANLRANATLPADRLWTYSSVVDETTLCGAGEECDGIVLSEIASGEIMNSVGSAYSRKTTGVYSEVTINDTFTTGNEFMSDANGQIVNYVNAGDNRPLGKYLSSGLGGEQGKILLYSK